jgi:hypothetical protein
MSVSEERSSMDQANVTTTSPTASSPAVPGGLGGEAPPSSARAAGPRPSLGRWIVKGLLFVIVLVTFRLYSTIRRFPIVALMVVIAVLGTWMALASGVLALPRLGGAPVVSDGRLAVETYLTGQQRLNSALMWEALSEDYRAAMQRAGRSAADLQAQMERGKREGISYTGFQYVASTSLRDGRGVYLYIVTADVATPQGTSTQQNPYTFTVDRSGKIINIE